MSRQAQEEHESHRQDETKKETSMRSRRQGRGMGIQERRYELGRDILLDNDRADMDYGMV